MYKVRIIADGQQWDPDGDGHVEPCPVGTEITHPDAWRLCLRGMRNAPPIAEPADDVTRQRVADHINENAPRKAAVLQSLQNQINALANNAKLGLKFDESGQPLRDASGEIVGRLSNLQRHRLETAMSYGLVPVVAGVTPAAPLAAAPPVPASPAAASAPPAPVPVPVPAPAPAAEPENEA